MDNNYLYCLKSYSQLVNNYKHRTLLSIAKYRETKDDKYLFKKGEPTHDIMYKMIMDLERDIKEMDPTFKGMG